MPASTPASPRSPSAADHRLSVLVPVYRSEATIGRLVDTVVETLGPRLWEIILVNDGSPDNSHRVILDAMQRHPGVIRYVRLYRNFGEHNAVMCGLNYVTGDCVAIIDDDFQNPPAEILALVETLFEGDYDVVYSYYEKKQHSLFRNLGSRVNDLAATLLLDKPRDLYLSSFKVLRAELARLIVQYRGPFPYIDGLILRTTTHVGRQLVRHETRAEGRSSYTLRKLIHLWLNMFTGFSVVPLRIAAFLGLSISFLAMLMVIYFVVIRFTGPLFLNENLPPGWTSTITAITFFAGLQLSVLGIVGEYLGRLFLTTNGQPQFIVRDTAGIEPAGEPPTRP